MVNERTTGHIVKIDESGAATITAVLPNLYHACDRKYDTVEIILPDGRRITPKQRRFCYMLLGAIAEHVDGIRNAETVEDAKQMMKMEFALERMESMERKLFSLSDVDETTANAFINFIIDFIIKQDIPTSFSLLENCEDIAHFVYACLANKKCCVCGKHADVHHVTGSKIGAGNNRDEVHHLGREVLPLCREHHEICHNDEKSFIEKYHLEPIELTAELCKKLHLKV
jgi:hypothetical protein